MFQRFQSFLFQRADLPGARTGALPPIGGSPSRGARIFPKKEKKPLKKEEKKKNKKKGKKRKTFFFDDNFSDFHEISRNCVPSCNLKTVILNNSFGSILYIENNLYFGITSPLLQRLDSFD